MVTDESLRVEERADDDRRLTVGGSGPSPPSDEYPSDAAPNSSAIVRITGKPIRIVRPPSALFRYSRSSDMTTRSRGIRPEGTELDHRSAM